MKWSHERKGLSMEFIHNINEHITINSYHQGTYNLRENYILTITLFVYVQSCAPRYVYFTSSGEKREPIGVCFLYKHSRRSNSITPYYPCKTGKLVICLSSVINIRKSRHHDRSCCGGVRIPPKPGVCLLFRQINFDGCSTCSANQSE